MHDSVGGQPTLGFDVSFTKIATGCKYKNVFGPVANKNEIIKLLEYINREDGSNFLEIQVSPGSRTNLGRPSSSPSENKKLFIDKLNDN